MTESTTDFNSYHAGSVLQHFNIAADDSVEARSVRFLHKMIGRDYEGEMTYLKKTEFSKEMVEITIRNIGIRYNLYRKYADNFFQGDTKINYNALKMAVICNGYIMNANEESEYSYMPHDNDNKDKIVRRDDGLKNKDVIKARKLWLEAEAIMDYGRDPDDVYWQESLFLAHIMCLEKISDLEDDLLEPDPDQHQIDEFKLFLKTSAERMRSVADTDSDIGLELLERLGILREMVELAVEDFSPKLSVAPLTPAPVKPGPKLTLVHPPEPL